MSKPDPNYPPDEPIRLSKLMAQRGICSRREADDYISRGLVYVDGVKIDVLGTKILPHQKIALDEIAKKEQRSLVTFLLNKPIGYVSGQAEKGYKPASDLLIPENRAEEFEGPAFRKEHLWGLSPAGRLDIDSKGLLVFTQDGRLAKLLTGDPSDIEKEYLVRVEGEVDDSQLDLLEFGLSLDDKPLLPAKVEWVNHDQLRFIIKEGKKRQIRRMCEMVGLKVTGLKRVRIGHIPLGKLPTGQWRYLLPGERF